MILAKPLQNPQSYSRTAYPKATKNSAIANAEVAGPGLLILL